MDAFGATGFLNNMAEKDTSGGALTNVIIPSQLPGVVCTPQLPFTSCWGTHEVQELVVPCIQHLDLSCDEARTRCVRFAYLGRYTPGCSWELVSGINPYSCPRGYRGVINAPSLAFRVRV